MESNNSNILPKSRVHSKSQSKIVKKSRFRKNPLSNQGLESNLLKNENNSLSPFSQKLSFDKYSNLIKSSMQQYVLTAPPPKDPDDSDYEENKEDYKKK